MLKFALSGLVFVVIELIDNLPGVIDLPWIVSALIALVLVFGGFIIIETDGAF